MEDEMARQYVAYYRVSTQRQHRSGLGLEAQEQDVHDYLKRTCNGAEIVAEFTEEAESGRRSDRPELERALAECRLRRAVLVVAKVDRLTRCASFLHHILDSGVEVVFCDLPQIEGPAGKFILNQMVAVAELEAGFISQRTKSALAAAKRRGVKLGTARNLTPGGIALGSRRGNETKQRNARQHAADLMPTMTAMMAGGTTTLQGLADALNKRGVPSARGGRWWPSGVRSVLMRAGDALGLGR